MGGDDEGLARCPQFLEEPEDTARIDGIEGGRGLVEEDDLGIGREDSDECQPLALAFAELVWSAVTKRTELVAI